MGNLQHCIKNPKQNKPTSSLDDLKEKLQFEVAISNIRAKGLEKAGTYLEFSFGNHKKLFTNVKYSLNPIWDDQFQFSYEESIFSLQNSSLFIKIYSK